MTDSVWVAIASGSFGLLTAAVVLSMSQKYQSQERDRDRDREERRWEADRADHRQQWIADRDTEERRWSSEKGLARRFELLNDLHIALVDAYFSLNLYMNMPAQSLEEFKQEVEKKVDAYLRAKVLAEIYLNEAQEKIMATALGAFRDAKLVAWSLLPDEAFPRPRSPEFSATPRTPNLKDFTESYELAQRCLRALLVPAEEKVRLVYK